MSTVRNILSLEIESAITTAATDKELKDNARSLPAIMLIDIVASIAAITDAAMPKESSYHMVGDRLVVRFKETFKANDRQTNANNMTMVRNATNGELHRRATAINTAAIAAKAAEAVAEMAKPTKAATTKAANTAKAAKEAAAVVTPVSLDKAAKQGVKIAKRKTSNIKVRQVKANKAGKTRSAKPTKLQEAAKAEKRQADKELILQGLDYVTDIHGQGEAAKPADILTALGGIANVAALIVEYLPTDMRTL